jgi:hypothetical protein
MDIKLGYIHDVEERQRQRQRQKVICTSIIEEVMDFFV